MAFTIVLCSGAWPLLEFFDPLIKAFELKNQKAICKITPSYPNYSPEDPPKINPDSEYLRNSVLEPLLQEGKDIVLFAHSYGGIYAPASVEGMSKKERQAKGLEGGIIGIILNAAFVASKGTSAIAAMGIDPENLPEWIVHDESTGLVSFEKESAKTRLYHDLPPDEAERLANALPPQPYACFATPTHWDPYQDPNFKGKVGYIFTEADRILPFEVQQIFVQMGNIEKTHLMKDSSHSPHLEQPDELADVVLKLVKAITEEK
ncbi:alpha/beta-hydrolase [Thozetella sp. PMI_491]|nr:alpha/beta-hydrolase [Thozetella sp. PMI_491]